jgi:hypothetical protein
MDKLNHWMTLIGNVGIIAGVVFLAYELQQNNELLVQESRYSMLQNSKDWIQFNAGSEEISNLIFLDSGETLSELDETRRFNILVGNMLAWQWEWEQSRSGLFGETELPVPAFRAFWRVLGLDRNWPEIRETLDPSFVIFMENEVAN